MELVAVIIGLIVVSVVIYGIAQAAKRRRLMEKYGDAAIVEKIMRRRIWDGMTAEQLIDSWGHPAAVDQNFFKTKTKEIYKYNQDGKNRFRERVTVENGVVVGWSQRK